MAGDRISLEVSSVGTDWVTQSVTTPKHYQIIRATIKLESGTGTQVAFRLREKTDKHTRLEYSLTTGTIDSLEASDNVRVLTKERLVDNYRGTSYLAVKCDSGTNNVISIEIDIEIL